MHIGCDLDGVIIDHTKNQMNLLARRGFNIPELPISNELLQKIMTSAMYARFKSELYGKLSLGAAEINGAKDALTRLSHQGHELYLISRRDKDRQFALQWLEEKGFDHIFPTARRHFVATDRDKDIVCNMREIALHIDDSPEVLDILTAPQYKILFGSSISSYPKATYVAKNWAEVSTYIDRVG